MAVPGAGYTFHASCPLHKLFRDPLASQEFPQGEGPKPPIADPMETDDDQTPMENTNQALVAQMPADTVGRANSSFARIDEANHSS